MIKKISKRIKTFFDKNHWLVLTGILAAFTATALGNIGRWSIWFDESFSAYIVRFDFAKIAHFTAHDVHPPLYYWLLKCWTLLFGNSVVTLRTMSIFFAVIGLVGLYFVVRKITKSNVYSLGATVVAAFMPAMIRFSDEARMYTLVFAIVMWATYFLLRAQNSKGKKWWIGYSALIMLGMLTHYFVALAWIAHWVWRYCEVRSGRIKKFFSKPWTITYAAAVGMYAWWLPTVIKQFTTVQVSGFWIPPVSAATPTNYLGDMLMYRENGELSGWWALLLFVTIVTFALVVWRTLPKVKRSFDFSEYRLLAALAITPPVVLFISSLPPLRSSFVTRYALFAQAITVVLLAIIAFLALENKKGKKMAAAALVAIAVCYASGIYHVYDIGNYNKNTKFATRTGDVMQKISESGKAGQPVVAASQWVYYDAAAYSNDEHPVYYNAEGMTYYYGSELMLKEDDTGKINSLSDFAKKYRYIWYVTSESGDLRAPIEGWKLIKTIESPDPISGKTNYQAGLFDTSLDD